MKFDFDPFSKKGGGGFNPDTIVKAAKAGQRTVRIVKARSQARWANDEFGPEVAEAVRVAVQQGRSAEPILARARKDKAAREERDRLLANPPPLHGSARWATDAEIAPYLKGRDGLDTPGSIYLGAYGDKPLGYVHWAGAGHLLTVAPTRAGKALTTIIPNLLRYRGSVVVLDPKGELYEATSAWRAANVGPVYRWAPFDEDSTLPRHRFNPLDAVKTEQHARALADQLFPADPRASEFFAEDAVAFITALIMFLKSDAPAEQQHFGMLRKLASLPLPTFKAMLEQRMANSSVPLVREAAHNVLGKSDKGLPNLRDTVHSKLSRLAAPALLESLQASDFAFGNLKDKPATVYVQVPFPMMATYAPVLRLVLQSALDAMIENRTIPAIPVLFVLDEFLQLGRFAQFRDAIRSHAGAGVRLWFFVQDIAGLEQHYADAWRPFFNCAVRQYFGVNDQFTAEAIANALGVGTIAWRATNAGANVSASQGGDTGNAGVSLSSGESVAFSGRQLMTPREVISALSGWKDAGLRESILDLDGLHPVRAFLTVYEASVALRGRVGAWKGKNHG